MRRAFLISLLLALALAAAGCGASAETDADESPDLEQQTTATETEEQETVEEEDAEETQVEGAPIASAAIVQRFKRLPGAPALRSLAGPDVSWEQLGLGLNATPAQQRRFGTFTIYVVEPDRVEAVESLLADKDTAQPLAQSAGGIYWDFDELAGSYVASKRYGSNVVLTWWSEKRKPQVDARFERLDALLQELVDG